MILLTGWLASVVLGVCIGLKISNRKIRKCKKLRATSVSQMMVAGTIDEGCCYGR